VIQRDILFEDIDALTVSTSSDEFIIHVKEDADERFSCLETRKDVLQMIVYLSTNSIAKNSPKDTSYEDNKRMKVYFVSDLSLDLYLTTDDDIDDNKVVRPDNNYLQKVTYKEYLNLENQFLLKKEARRKSTKTIYCPFSQKAITIDDFVLLKTLGRGAHGKVLLCERKNFPGERYAMKIIKKQHIIDANQLEHTIAEKVILSNLNHPFLVSLKIAFQNDDKIYFVMEFMKGGELFQHLRRYKSFTEEQTKFVTACIILALGHLHNQDYIYRDLKPENVLMDEKGYTKLTDFGLAKELGVTELARTFCGTPEYLAPEVILDKGCNRPADWWSLGILVYEMMFGIPPFYSKDVQEMYKNTILNPLKFKPRPKISDEAKDFIAGLLVKAPSKRLGSCADSLEVMNHPWFKDFNWSKLLEKKLTPPFNLNDKEWEKNFDPGFIKETAKDSFCNTDRSKLKDFQDKFKAFDVTSDESEIEDHVDEQKLYSNSREKNNGLFKSSLPKKFIENLENGIDSLNQRIEIPDEKRIEIEVSKTDISEDGKVVEEKLSCNDESTVKSNFKIQDNKNCDLEEKVHQSNRIDNLEEKTKADGLSTTITDA
jgi:serum/glucocorticoid-regulated kinase 2